MVVSRCCGWVSPNDVLQKTEVYPQHNTKTNNGFRNIHLARTIARRMVLDLFINQKL